MSPRHIWAITRKEIQHIFRDRSTLFLVLASTYAAKAIRHPDAVRAELDHPALLSFFPTITISLILIGTFLATWTPVVALLCWQIGATGQLLLTLLILAPTINGAAP